MLTTIGGDTGEEWRLQGLGAVEETEGKSVNYDKRVILMPNDLHKFH